MKILRTPEPVYLKEQKPNTAFLYLAATDRRANPTGLPGIAFEQEDAAGRTSQTGGTHSAVLHTLDAKEDEPTHVLVAGPLSEEQAGDFAPYVPDPSLSFSFTPVRVDGGYIWEPRVLYVRVEGLDA